MEEFKDYFNALPTDIKYEILKHKPFSRQLSKNYINPQFNDLYYNQYCDLPISKKEIKNYIHSQPDFFTLYIADEKDGLPRFMIHEFIKKDDDYRVMISEFYVSEDDIDEFYFYIDYHKENINLTEGEYTFDSIDLQSYLYEFNLDSMDLQSTIEIYKQRQCPYKEKSIEKLSNYITGNNMLDAFNTLKNNMIIHHEWIAIYGDDGYSIDHEPLFHAVFNRWGTMIGDKINFGGIVLETDYEAKKQDLINWINTMHS